MFIHYVGLDVHKDSIKIAVADDGRDKARFLASIPNDSNKLLKKLHKIGSKDSIQCCYEAGPGDTHFTEHYHLPMLTAG